MLPVITAENQVSSDKQMLLKNYLELRCNIHCNPCHSQLFSFFFFNVGGFVGDRYLWRVCGPHGRAVQRILGYR